MQCHGDIASGYGATSVFGGIGFVTFIFWYIVVVDMRVNTSVERNILPCNQQEVVQMFLDHVPYMADKMFYKLNDQNARLAKSSVVTMLQLCKLPQVCLLILYSIVCRHWH